jgi:transketolase
MNTIQAEFLRKKADFIRGEVINISLRNNFGHIASSLSSVDILTALYYYALKKGDRLVFSKGHGCYGLYAILTDLGIMPKNKWQKPDGKTVIISGCVERAPEYGLEAGCGSLGHGLPVAVGMAFAAMLKRKKYHTFCVIGDGEMQEGTTWEALQFAVKHKLRNLTVIVDSNQLQAMDFIVKVMDRKKDDKIKRLKGFGLTPLVCRGHNPVKLAERMSSVKSPLKGMPRIIIAETIKGYGLRCMENVPKFHFRVPAEAEIAMGRSYGKKK